MNMMVFIRSLIFITFAIVAVATPLAQPREENGVSRLN